MTNGVSPIQAPFAKMAPVYPAPLANTAAPMRLCVILSLEARRAVSSVVLYRRPYKSLAAAVYYPGGVLAVYWRRNTLAVY